MDWQRAAAIFRSSRKSIVTIFHQFPSWFVWTERKGHTQSSRQSQEHFWKKDQTHKHATTHAPVMPTDFADENLFLPINYGRLSLIFLSAVYFDSFVFEFFHFSVAVGGWANMVVIWQTGAKLRIKQKIEWPIKCVTTIPIARSVRGVCVVMKMSAAAAVVVGNICVNGDNANNQAKKRENNKIIR